METYKVFASNSDNKEVVFEIKATGFHEARDVAFESCYRMGLCFESMFLSK